MGSLLGSLRFRSAAAHVLLIVAAFAALGLYLLPKVEGDFRGGIEDDLASQARMAQNLAQPLLEADASRGDFDRLAKELGANTGTRVTIIAADGTVLGDSEADPATTENHFGRPEVQEALRSGRGSDERTSATIGEPLTYVALRVGPSDSPFGFVRVARSTASVDASLSDITRSVLVAVLVTALAAAGISLLISETVLRPLGRLVSAVRSVGYGRLQERIEPRPWMMNMREAGELADAFNQMGRNLQDMIAAASQDRNRMLAALNSSSDAVIAIDSEGRMRFANVAAEKLFMRRHEEFLGDPFLWLMPTEKSAAAVAAAQAGTRRTLTAEHAGRSLHVMIAPIAGGGEWTSLIVIHDVTDVKRAEQTRRDFIANVSHELRTPLASIKSVIETLQDGAMADPAVAQDFLARADEEVDRLVQIVEELLELSRIESGQAPLARKPVEVTGVLGRAVERLRARAEKLGVGLTLDVERILPPVTGDEERLERAVLNLVHNAIKFTPAGGSVIVSAARLDGEIAIHVADTGVGIAPEDLPRIFERFYKADLARAHGGAGTGLGLAVVKHTIEAHGGRVSAKSSPGEGSTFTITLPVAPLPIAG